MIQNNFGLAIELAIGVLVVGLLGYLVRIERAQRRALVRLVAAAERHGDERAVRPVLPRTGSRLESVPVPQVRKVAEATERDSTETASSTVSDEEDATRAWNEERTDGADRESSPHGRPASATRVSIPTFGAEGNPLTKSIRVDTLLRGVGIDPHTPSPEAAIVSGVEDDLLALAELCDLAQDTNLSLPGMAGLLEGAARRLGVATELLDTMQTARRASPEGRAAPASEASPSESPAAPADKEEGAAPEEMSGEAPSSEPPSASTRHTS
jgi:hypothetical protein